VDALLGVLDNRRSIGGVFNIGSTEEITILRLAERIIEHTGSSSPIQLIPYEEAYNNGGFEDMRRRVPDTTRIEMLTGWRPRLTLDDILRDSIEEVRRQAAADVRPQVELDLTAELMGDDQPSMLR
jgi:UDP-glucose 4-epimerase